MPKRKKLDFRLDDNGAVHIELDRGMPLIEQSPIGLLLFAILMELRAKRHEE